MILRILLVVAGMALAGPGAAATLTADEMRTAAIAALRAGDAGLAGRLATALLSRDPADDTALVIRAQAARLQGANGEARKAAAAAWARADTPAERFRAARLRGVVLSDDGAHTRAQWWLRRASQEAPTPRARALAVRDFRRARARNPWRMRFDFAITPSSNINNGSAAETIIVGGLPFRLNGRARALSGVETRAGIDASRRVLRRDDLTLRLGGTVEARRYRLSESARREAPTLDASDLSYTSGALRLEARAGDMQAQTEIARSWYGGAPLADTLRAGIGRGWRVGEGQSVSARLIGTRQWRRDQPALSLREVTLRGAWRRETDAGGAVRLGFGLRRTASDSAVIAHRAALAGIDWQVGRSVAGAALHLSFDLEARHYDEPLLGTAPREDTIARAGLDLVLSERDYMGFAPTIGLNLSRRRSSFDLYDSDTATLSLGLRSVF